MNSKLRSLGYEDYGISKKRYWELRAVCQQYQEREAALRYGAKGVSYNAAPSGSGTAGDPTAAAAAYNAKLSAKNDKIRSSARQASEGIPGLYEAILESVTKGVGYYDLRHEPPMAPTDFYGYRRYFYHLLDQVW